MQSVSLPIIGTVVAWREKARELAAQGVSAEAVIWSVGRPDPGLFDGLPELGDRPAIALRLPREAVASIETALCHNDPERFARAYRLVLRLGQGQVRWGDRSDTAQHRLLTQEKTVRRDIHKMHAFVRFREVPAITPDRRAFVAWFEPDHFITEAASPFFARRFGDMDWAIATPYMTARFVGGHLTHEVTSDVTPPPADATEDLWRTYYANIFNPARLMVSAMTSEMPRKYWKNLPEAGLIPELIRTAPARAQAMQSASPTRPPAHLARIVSAPPAAPMATGLDSLKRDLDACRRCPIGACATQGVAGEGPRDATLMIVGEQPGDHEDLVGRPFVGPAGQIFDIYARQAGLARAKCYVTNAVKHFKFKLRGVEREHRTPDKRETAACRPWLMAEIEAVKPQTILTLGVTAGRALLGPGFTMKTDRGHWHDGPEGAKVRCSYHPAAILRSPDAAVREELFAALCEDIALVKAA